MGILSVATVCIYHFFFALRAIAIGNIGISSVSYRYLISGNCIGTSLVSHRWQLYRYLIGILSVSGSQRYVIGTPSVSHRSHLHQYRIRGNCIAISSVAHRHPIGIGILPEYHAVCHRYHIGISSVSHQW